MNKNKIDKALDIKTEQVQDCSVMTLESDPTDLMTVQPCDEMVAYTENPELIKDIARYKEQREENITTLTDARSIIKGINIKISDIIKSDGDPSAKDIDAFAKIGNTLVNITREIDEQSGPNKIEMFLDTTKVEKETPQTINNTQINITSTPAQILKILEDKVKDEKNSSGNEKT